MNKVCQCERDLQICPSDVVAFIAKGGDVNTVKAFFTIHEMGEDETLQVRVGAVVLRFDGLDPSSSNFHELRTELTALFLQDLMVMED